MIVITGASSGLGQELSKLYKKRGTKVINVSRRSSRYADLNINQDLRLSEEITKVAREILKLPDPLEAVINCAGIYSGEPLGEITAGEVESSFAINIQAPILLISQLINRIKKDGTDIVNISSLAGIIPYKESLVYGACKKALVGFSADLQASLKMYPCRVIDLAPASFGVPMQETSNKDAQPAITTNRMSVEALAELILYILDLPKNMEVSEIVINRKIAT